MANCGECGIIIEEDSNPVKCVGGCERVFHLDCIKEKFKTRTGHKDWKCEECVKSKKQSSVSSKSSGSTSITKEFLVSTMEAFKREMFKEFKSHSGQMQELTKSVEFLSANIDTANQALEKVQLDYAEIMKQNQRLTEANLKLGETVNELKSKVRELEQYSRRTNLEICGIPVTRNEDTMKILRDIGTAIGVELHDTQVMAAHRVPSYKQGRAPPMVVQFQTKMQRDVWITNYKKNKDLSARRVNNAFPDTRVYINEHLSPDNKIFLAQLKERKIDNNFIVAQAFVFFLAGYETPGNILACTLFEVAKQPAIQESLYEEIESILNKYGGEVTFDALQDMKYLRQVVSEALRKYTPLTLIFRRCTKDYTIPDTSIVIEKGTLVLMPLRSIHEDPDHYPDPEAFDPERFSDENSASRHIAAYMPFGIGPRFCPAVLYSHINIRTALVFLLRQFEVRVTEKTPEYLQPNPLAFLMSPKNGIPLAFKSRH